MTADSPRALPGCSRGQVKAGRNEQLELGPARPPARPPCLPVQQQRSSRSSSSNEVLVWQQRLQMPTVPAPALGVTLRLPPPPASCCRPMCVAHAIEQTIPCCCTAGVSEGSGAGWGQRARQVQGPPLVSVHDDGAAANPGRCCWRRSRRSPWPSGRLSCCWGEAAAAVGGR